MVYKYFFLTFFVGKLLSLSFSFFLLSLSLSFNYLRHTHTAEYFQSWGNYFSLSTEVLHAEYINQVHLHGDDNPTWGKSSEERWEHQKAVSTDFSIGRGLYYFNSTPSLYWWRTEAQTSRGTHSVTQPVKWQPWHRGGGLLILHSVLTFICHNPSQIFFTLPVVSSI